MPHTCLFGKRDYASNMKTIWLLVLACALILVVAGCSSEPPRGDREYIPGKGWVPVSN